MRLLPLVGLKIAKHGISHVYMAFLGSRFDAALRLLNASSSAAFVVLFLKENKVNSHT